jgi:hypothetical protein
MKSVNVLSLITVAVAMPFVGGCQNTRTASSGATQNQSVAAAKPTPATAPAQTLAQPASFNRSSNDDLVPNMAKPGECYARVIIPTSYRTVTETVLDREASKEIQIIPAEYETVTENVLVKAASERLEIVPASYKNVEEKVLVAAESKRLVTIPAEFQTVSERILVKPESTMWKKGADPLHTVEGATGEIMCLVTTPAEYKTVEKSVQVRPASTKQEVIPAEYRTVEKTVMVTPPTTRKIEIPAEYKTMTVTRVKTPAREVVKEIPATYKTISRQVLASPSRTEWRRILCETNVTASVISSLQSALTAKGFDTGGLSGKIDAPTRDAVTRFQMANNLATGGITYETMEKLGVRP